MKGLETAPSWFHTGKTAVDRCAVGNARARNVRTGRGLPPKTTVGYSGARNARSAASRRSVTAKDVVKVVYVLEYVRLIASVSNQITCVQFFKSLFSRKIAYVRLSTADDNKVSFLEICYVSRIRHYFLIIYNFTLLYIIIRYRLF